MFNKKIYITIIAVLIVVCVALATYCFVLRGQLNAAKDEYEVQVKAGDGASNSQVVTYHSKKNGFIINVGVTNENSEIFEKNIEHIRKIL